MWFTLAIVVVVILMFLSRNKWYSKGELDTNTFIRTLAKYFIVSILAAFLLTFVGDTIVIVPAGHRGVIFDSFKGVRQQSLKEGLNFIIPFVQEAILMDVRIQKVESKASAASKDLQSVETAVTLNIHPIPEEVYVIYQKVGIDYTNKVVHPAVQEAVKAATARYTAEELITKREDVKRQIRELLELQLKPVNLVLLETYITDFEFSKDFSHAIESKQIAEQQALKAKRDLDRIKIEADQKIASAHAEAEALKMQKEAISANLIQLRSIEAQKMAIEKWNGVLPNIMMGDTLPFIDMSKFIKSGKQD